MKKLLIYKKKLFGITSWLDGKIACTKKFPSMVNNIGPSLVAMEP